MKTLIRMEELGMLAFSIFLFYLSPFDWWWYPALILAPDISMAGYLVNTRVGAACYNFFHHKGIALVVYMAGLFFNSEILQITGLILFGHSCLDRMLGYGLKFNDSFQNTHLGKIGK